MIKAEDLAIRDNRIVIKEFTSADKHSFNWVTLVTINPQKVDHVYRTLQIIADSISI